jgi:hypothetical protein
MAHWNIINKNTGNKLNEQPYESREIAETRIAALGSFLSQLYEAQYEHENPLIKKMINEGLVKDDLEGILLSLILVDVHVPSDPNSDNIVISFLIRGVPEAVQPFKNFAEHSKGVLDIDFGDSETIQNCSVVYVEFDRQKLEIKDIHNLLVQVGVMAGLKINEFTLSFPNSDKKFPYSLDILKKYFAMRSKKANQIAQKQALVAKTRALQKEIGDEIKKAKSQGDAMRNKNGQPPEDQQEAPQNDAQAPQEPQEGKPDEAPQEAQNVTKKPSKKSGGDIAKQAEGIAAESLINRLVALI